jgi:hypothetical protein
VNGAHNISELFLSKYDELYNSVSYDASEMNAVKDSLDSMISSKCASGSCTDSEHCTTVDQVCESILFMKGSKHDGQTGHYSDHIINGTRKLHVFLSLLFSSMIFHGCAPDGLHLSTLIPIPKNKRKSLNDSNNYRAIALSSVLGKLLDRVILSKHYDKFATSDYQYGFKKQHSTVHCTFVVKEVIQYYLNNSTDVYSVLLDASRAFDRVNYVKLFKLFIKRNLCPTVARFLANMYTSQSIRVKWGNFISNHVPVTNGVKQGGVLSPILFIIYMDELLRTLSLCGVGCYVGNMYCGSFGYADDVILLAPTLYSVKKLLCICETFAKEYDVIFNSQKSKLLVYRCNNNSHINEHLRIDFMDGHIVQSLNEKHLGNTLGPKCNSNMISETVNDFYVKVNIVLSHFMHAHSHIRYKLFKSYCMTLYGSQLWDFQSKIMENFYVAWRKSVRRILGVPPTTHCKYLHYIADDRDIKGQLHKRFIKFIQSVHQSSNLISNLCVRLALSGSRSNNIFQ